MNSSRSCLSDELRLWTNIGQLDELRNFEKARPFPLCAFSFVSSLILHWELDELNESRGNDPVQTQELLLDFAQISGLGAKDNFSGTTKCM